MHLLQDNFLFVTKLFIALVLWVYLFLQVLASLISLTSGSKRMVNFLQEFQGVCRIYHINGLMQNYSYSIANSIALAM